MKRSFAFFILFLIVFTGSVGASLPDWFREGVYVKYAMKMVDNPRKDEVNIFMIWPRLLPKDTYGTLRKAYESDTLKIDNRSMISLFVRGDSYLTFEVLNLTNETAFIRVTLELNNVSTDSLNNIPRLVISKVLRLNLSDMMYYESDGTPIGAPAFFIDPAHPPKKGDYILTPAFLKKYELLSDDIVVTNVSFTWNEDKILHTYYRDFIPPYLFVDSEGAYLIHDLNTGEGHVLMAGRVYELDTGLLITTGFYDVGAEITSLGVIGAVALDRVNSRKLHKLIEEGKADKEWWAVGFNLYDTNVKLPEYGCGRSPSTPVKYFFALSLAILILTFLWKRWRWKNE
ncbi:hypothetical protein A3L12_04190 [Thermococcus sp. P6]|uniref:hypothetical protein n=1 Tax=Thermococcus sp. P6 TaxID=122420 RepID=UPI000B5A2049|nr:hypothetical protein [Thermococcus sp. P6]ASJ10552.1 hypothetical protein A3L12_04190 [Thermococcus sp. P6]